MKTIFFIVPFALAVAAPCFGARLNPMEDADMLELIRQRGERQARGTRELGVFHGFGFTDRFGATGITFTNQAVEDAGKYFKPAHYDHGTGVAAADVDGDGKVDLYFVNQAGANGLWRNLGGGKFEDMTAAAGVGLEGKVSAGASFADIDNDGDPDLFVTTVKMGNVLFENLGEGKFRDISKAAGVDYRGHSSGAVFFDVNRDGLVDLFVCNVGTYTTSERGAGGYFRALPDAFSGHTKPERTERSLLYMNLGNRRFEERSAAMGLNDTGWTGDAAFADVNGDGYPDLYVLSMQGDDRFYINRSGERFEERTAEYFPKTPWGSMGVKFFDFDGDGRLDLYVTDMHSDMTGQQTKLSQTFFGSNFEVSKSERWCTAEYTEDYLLNSGNNLFGNALYRNTGRAPFEELSGKAEAETFWPWGVSVGDLNADGHPDAFITAGMGFGFRYGINSLLLNDRGKEFFGAECILGIEPRAGGVLRKTAFVLDCSGADSGHPLCEGRTGEVPFSEPLSSRSSVMLDLDRDGDLDIVANEMNHRPQVLMSDLSERAEISWVKVELQGTESNRDGLGTLVKVVSANGETLQQQDGKSGYLSQSSLPLYFGLGEAKRAERIEVVWPSGRKQTVEDVPAGETVTIRETGGERGSETP